VQFHHNPLDAGEFKEQAIFIHAVNCLCYQLKIGMMPNSFVTEQLNDKAIEQIGLKESFLQGLQGEFQIQLQEMEKLFGMIGPE